MAKVYCLLLIGLFFFTVSCEKYDQPNRTDEDEWVVQLLDEEDLDDLSLDMFFIDTAFVDGDSLRLSISHSGGCRTHQYYLWELSRRQNQPIELILEHESNGDLCEAMVYADLAFSLTPLREKKADSISFLLRGSPVMSSYYGSFTYRW